MCSPNPQELPAQDALTWVFSCYCRSVQLIAIAPLTHFECTARHQFGDSRSFLFGFFLRLHLTVHGQMVTNDPYPCGSFLLEN